MPELATTIINIVIIIAILGGIGFILYFLGRMYLGRRKMDWALKQNYTLLAISVPRENEKSPLAAEQMFASLHGIYKSAAELRAEGAIQQFLSFEMVSSEKYLRFYVYTPIVLKDFVEGQIYAQYPKVEIKQVEDYSKSFDPKKTPHFATSELLLTKEDVYPIKTFLNFDVDPLAGITAVLSKVQGYEQVWIQILVRPVDDSWQNRGINYVEAVKSGTAQNKSVFKSISSGAASLASDLVKHATNPEAAAEATTKSKEEAVELPGPVKTSLEGIEQKITKLGFETKIRIIGFAADEAAARSKLHAAVGAFKQFNATNINGFASGKIEINNKEALADYQARIFPEQIGYVLNIEELASIFHLPNVSVETPSIVWAGSKKGEPPANLPIKGIVPEEELSTYAKTDFRNVPTEFGIKTEDRRHHLYTIGKTGTGKTTMLENMAIDDIREGKGVAIVDPHGDFVERILHFIPSERVDDVVLFDPSDKDYPIGFNLLENVNPDLKNIVASGLVGIFQKIWAFTWGPRLEHILRNCILALLDYPDSTLLGVLKMLVDDTFRRKVTERIQDPVIREFWEKEFPGYNDRLRSEAVAPIQNKVGQFVSSPTIRNIIGQPKSTINMDDIMNNRKILLINLSKGKIGEDNSALLGAMMITKIQLTAMQRANVPEVERHDFYLYVDEFQNFATESFATIFSEARKYKLNIVVANQYITQMPEVVRESVFGNVGTLIAFRVGAGDAPFLAKEFQPIFEENDLVNLDKYHVYIKMCIDGVTSPAFSAITLPPATQSFDTKEQVIQVSRSKYGTKREIVEEQINKWSRESSEPDVKPSDSNITSTSITTSSEVNRMKAKGPSGVIKVGDIRYNEYVTREGDRWYQEVPSDTKSGNTPSQTPEAQIRTSSITSTSNPSSNHSQTISPSVDSNKIGNIHYLSEGEDAKIAK